MAYAAGLLTGLIVAFASCSPPAEPSNYSSVTQPCYSSVTQP
jgi:hypothetical protein